MRSLVKIKVKVKSVESDGNFAADDTSTCLGLSTCLKTKWTAKMSMSSRIRPIRTPPPIVRYLSALSDMSHLLLLGKFEYGGGPIFKVVLEC